MQTAAGTTSARVRQLRKQLRRGVSYFGVLDRISHEQFVEIVEAHQGRYVSYAHHAPISLLVVGAGDLPVTNSGDPVEFRGREVIGEAEFLSLLKVQVDPSTEHTFTARSLSELLHVPEQRLRAWLKAGLIHPRAIEHGLMKFDFRQASIARTLVNLHAAGVSVAKLRQSLSAVRRWLPNVAEPMQQLSLLEHNGPLLVRLESGDLAEIDGQLRLNFDADPHQPIPIRPLTAPRSAPDWHALGVEQEQSGYLAEAEESYRQALLASGPSEQVVFDLAHLLARRGRRGEAIERYRLVVELNPNHADAWNNLGLLLADAGMTTDAIHCLRKAVAINPSDAEAHYNLADLLDLAGITTEAMQHYQKFLQLDARPSPWVTHARTRLAEHQVV